MLERKLNIHYICQSSKFHFGREKTSHAWFELEPWRTFKAYPWNWFFLRDLVLHLLHRIIKTTLAGASTCKPNLIIKLATRVLPTGYTCRTTFHQWYLSLLWSERYISSRQQKMIQIYPQKWTWIRREHHKVGQPQAENVISSKQLVNVFRTGVRQAATSQSTIFLRTKSTAMKYYSSQLNFNSCNKIHTEKVERALQWDTRDPASSCLSRNFRHKIQAQRQEELTCQGGD